MKQIYQATMQAFLDVARGGYVEASAGQDADVMGAGAASGFTRTLVTRLGLLSLRSAEEDLDDSVAEFLARYRINEAKILVLMGRMLVRGWATSAILADMAETLCGRRLDNAWIAEIAARVNAEMPAYIERELTYSNHPWASDRVPRPPLQAPACAHATRDFLPDPVRCEA